MKQNKNKKAFRYSVNSTVLVVGAIVITLLFNAFLVTLNDRFALEIDFTQDGMYELTDTTKDVLGKLEDRVEVVMFTDGSESEVLSIVRNVLQKYTQNCGKIFVREINLIKNPKDLVPYQEAIDGQLTIGSILLQSGDKQEFISSSGFFTSEGRSKVERSITGKLTNFIDGMSISAIAYTAGHGEGSAEMAKDALETSAYKIETLDTLQGEFPADKNSLVVIHVPQNDFTAEEIEKLDAYLLRGGNVILSFDVNASPTLNRLEGYLASDWGITRSAYWLYDKDAMLGSNTPYLLAQFAEHEIVAPIKESDKKIILSLPNALSISGELPAGVEVMPVLTTTGNATAIQMDGTSVPEKAPGKENLMLAATRTNYDLESNQSVSGKLVVCGADILNMIDASFANEDLLLNTVSWMKGSESGLSISTKRLPGGALVISQAHFWTWFGILVIVIPIGVLIAGLVVFKKRRYK